MEAFRRPRRQKVVSRLGMAQLEHRDGLYELLRLRLEALGGGRASSTRAAFCCVTWSIWLTAVADLVDAGALLALAALISPMMSVTRLIDADDLRHRLAGLSTSAVPLLDALDAES